MMACRPLQCCRIWLNFHFQHRRRLLPGKARINLRVILPVPGAGGDLMAEIQHCDPVADAHDRL